MQTVTSGFDINICLQKRLFLSPLKFILGCARSSKTTLKSTKIFELTTYLSSCSYIELE